MVRTFSACFTVTQLNDQITVSKHPMHLEVPLIDKIQAVYMESGRRPPRNFNIEEAVKSKAVLNAIKCKFCELEGALRLRRGSMSFFSSASDSDPSRTCERDYDQIIWRSGQQGNHSRPQQVDFPILYGNLQDQAEVGSFS